MRPDLRKTRLLNFIFVRAVEVPVQFSNSRDASVIASEAKQSRAGAAKRKSGLLRRFAPRNDGAPTSDACPRSRGAMRPGFARTVRPKKTEGAGNAGCPMHPQPRVRNKTKHTSVVTTGSPDSSRHSPRNGYTAYFVFSSATNSSCHRHPRIKGLSKPGRADAPPRI